VDPKERRMIELVRARLAHEDGQALVEYALLVTLIAVLAVGALTQIGNGGLLPGIFSDIASKL
jgi:Flp pilus assembly pilin Flp